MIHHFILDGAITQTKHLLNYIIIIGEKSTPTINWRGLSTADKRHLKYIFLKKNLSELRSSEWFQKPREFRKHAHGKNWNSRKLRRDRICEKQNKPFPRNCVSCTKWQHRWHLRPAPIACAATTEVCVPLVVNVRSTNESNIDRHNLKSIKNPSHELQTLYQYSAVASAAQQPASRCICSAV